MSPDLERLLAELKQCPLDHDLDRVTVDINRRHAERVAIAGQTWGLRAIAMALLVTGGAVTSASTASAVTAPKSPFAVWSQLAPSTLLNPSK